MRRNLNALVWCDHTDPALIAPFEEKFGVKVNLKEYEGTAAGLAILEQSQPGDWDVLVIDAVDVKRAVEGGHLAELPADKLPTADFFPELVMAENNTRGRQDLRRDREVRLQHHLLRQVQGRPGGHGGHGDADLRQV